MSSTLPLSTVPAALEREGFTPPSYRRVYAAALDRRIPAERGANGRWTVRPSDLPVIADALGLAPARAA